MAIIDNHQFISALEQVGEVVKIEDEVDWDLEAGAILQRGAELQSPAILMENITDYPGWRLFGNSIATYRRLAVAMGLHPDTPFRDILEEYYNRVQKPIKPVLIQDAPCQENILVGDDVDLMALPAPMLHDGDGGRYLCTWSTLVTKDPDTNWVNWGMYRAMIHNERYLTGLVLPGSDVGKIFYEKYAKYNKPMPFARAIGPDPISGLISGVPVGLEVNECDVAGGVLGEPVQLVKCKTVDLEVPAHAEIILEGELLPNITVDEGPFGEWLGFITFARSPQVVFKVNCITYRNNPILVVAIMGMPVNDDHLLLSVAYSAATKRLLQAQGIPVKDVFFPPHCGGLLCIVSTETPYSGIPNQIANVILGSRGISRAVHYIIIVGPDVDPFNQNEVMHSMTTLCDPKRGISIRHNELSNPLIPFLPFEDQRWARSSKAVFDCTWPVDWPKEKIPIKASFKTIYPQGIQDRVLQKWAKYF